MKFAHMADLHLGGWRDPELEGINRSVFEKAIDICISESVDFILISGDLFDVSMPPFDVLDLVSRKLNDAKRAGIPVYTISGSHDYSPSGKTILRVLENTELVINVAKGEEKDGKLFLKLTEDKSGAKITGIFGKKGSLEEGYYHILDRSIEKEPGYKIFMFHSGIEEYRPDYLKDVAALPLSLLPKGFDYYAGGHIHHRCEQAYGGGTVVFPGPLFPCNFQELERFKSGGFYLVENGKPEFVELKSSEVVTIKIDADGKSAKDVEARLEEEISGLAGRNFILLIRVSGTLSSGKPADINFRRLIEEAHGKGALAVRRNTNALGSREYEEIKVSADTVEQLEERIIREHIGQTKMKNGEKLVELLIKALDTEKLDGETNPDFEERVIREADRSLSNL